MEKVKNDHRQYKTRESLVIPKRYQSIKDVSSHQIKKFKEVGDFDGYMKRVPINYVED